MRAFRQIEARAAVLPIDNIDTDRIIPARFLKTTTRSGLGGGLFTDWPRGRQLLGDAEVLVAGDNFGCGSSREHAVWALLDGGVRVVISTGFADIFRANALRNALVPVVLKRDEVVALTRCLTDDPRANIRVDLEAQTVACADLEFEFDIDPIARDRITRGFVEIGVLLEQLPSIESFDIDRVVRFDTRGGSQ